MSAEKLARGDLSTLTQAAEISPPQTPDNVIYFNRRPLVEFTGNIQTSEGLERAGWKGFAEIKRFVGDINLGLINGLTLEQAVAFSTRILTDHIRFYNAEFVQQEPVLPHNNYFGIWQGKERWLGNNGRPVVDGVDGQERAGSVKRATEEAEKRLLEAENNSFIVSMSAQGESGYLDEFGRDIPHLNTLTMVDWKDGNGNLKGITLVTDLTVEQAEKVMEKLGAPANFLAKRGTEMQRVANILENLAQPVLPQSYDNPLEYVFDTILEVRGEEGIQLRQKKGSAETRPVGEMRQKIKNFQKLLDLDATKEQFIAELEKFILERFQRVDDPNFQQAIISTAEEVIWLFAGDCMDKKDNLPISRPLVLPQYTEIAGRITVLRPSDRDFSPEMAFLQSRAGCPSSRNSSARASTAGGVSGLGESDSKGSLYFPCPVCGAINKRPWEGFVNNCQSCGTDKVSCKSSGAKEEKKKEAEDLPKAA